MAKRLWLFMLIAMLALSLGQAAWAKSPSKEEVKALKAKVAEAAQLMAQDSARAQKEFNDPQSRWFAEPYVFAFKFDGTTLALPVEPAAVGTNRMNKKDVKGRSIVEQALRVVKTGKGEGWLDLKFKQPNRPGQPAVRKAVWVMRVPGQDAFVGAGLYDTTVAEVTTWGGKGR